MRQQLLSKTFWPPQLPCLFKLPFAQCCFNAERQGFLYHEFWAHREIICFLKTRPALSRRSLVLSLVYLKGWNVHFFIFHSHWGSSRCRFAFLDRLMLHWLNNCILIHCYCNIQDTENTVTSPIKPKQKSAISSNLLFRPKNVFCWLLTKKYHQKSTKQE